MAPRDRLPAALVLVACIFQLVIVSRELAEPPADFNDDVLHTALARAAHDAWRAGTDPTDPWLEPIVTGYPLGHHYQHLLHVVVGGLSAVFGLEVAWLLHWAVGLALILLPASVAWSMRWVGLDTRAAGCAGLLVPLVATNALYGIDLSSYLWGGYGLSTQAVGVLLLPLAWAATLRALRGEGNVLFAGATIAVLILTHTVFGWIAVMTAGVAALALNDDTLVQRFIRLAKIGAVTGLGAAYFVLPFLRDGAAMNRSVWESQDKYDSFGALGVLGKLASGALLDDRIFYGYRLPTITVLFALGLGLTGWRWRRHPKERVVLVLFGVWLALYFGRPAWGSLLDLLPMADSLHFHRLIVPVQLAAVALAGLGAASLWQVIERTATPVKTAAALIAVGLLATPVWERLACTNARLGWQEAALRAVEQDAGALERTFARISREPAARAYAGRAGNWGKKYTLGSLPVYALATNADIDNLGYLYHALASTADVQGYFDESRPSHYDLFNVRWFLAPSGQNLPSNLRFVSLEGRHQLGEAAPQGYVGLIDVLGPGGGAYGGDRQAFFEANRDWLGGVGPDLGWHPILALPNKRTPEAGASYRDIAVPRTAAAPRGRILSQRVSPGFAEAAVDLEREVHVMLKSTYHPGWRAEVDGESQPTVLVAPGFVATRVGPGSHRVVFRYEPGLSRALLRWGGWLAIAALALAPWVRRRLAARRALASGRG